MKYRIILKSGASFELDLDSDTSKDISKNMLAKSNIGIQIVAYDNDGELYCSVVSTDIVAIYRLADKKDSQDARKITAMLAKEYRAYVLDVWRDEPEGVTIKECYKTASFAGENYRAAKGMLK